MFTPTDTIRQFYQAIVAKDVTGICVAYIPAETTYVVLEGPRYTTRGYTKIAKGWHDFCQSSLTLEQIEWAEGPFEDVANTMAWVAGQIVLTVVVRERRFQVQFRATFVLKRSADDQPWQIAHEHVSGPLSDPYGIGDWLKT